MLQAVAETSQWTLRKIKSIRDLVAVTRTHVQRLLPKTYTAELVELCFEQPYCRISYLVDAEVAQRQAAARYLKALTSIGVLQEQRRGREKVFVNTRLLELLSSDSNGFSAFS